MISRAALSKLEYVHRDCTTDGGCEVKALILHFRAVEEVVKDLYEEDKRSYKISRGYWPEELLELFRLYDLEVER